MSSTAIGMALMLVSTDPRIQVLQRAHCLAEAEVGHPSSQIARQATTCWMLVPRVRRVSSRIRSFNRHNAFGPMVRLRACPWVKVKPRNSHADADATLLFAALTRSLKRRVMKSETLSITRWPARSLRT